jgi:hypothetical protein
MKVSNALMRCAFRESVAPAPERPIFGIFPAWTGGYLFASDRCFAIMQRFTNPAVAAHLFSRKRSAPPAVVSKVSLARIARTDPLALAVHLAALREPAEASGLAAGTHAGYDSAERYFGAFCAELGLNQDVFGLPESAGGFTPVQEDNIFELFAVYGVHFPRDAGKIARGELNTGETIAGYITGVKSNVELRTGRRPGLPDKENRRLRLLLQGLRKEAPRGTTPRPTRFCRRIFERCVRCWIWSTTRATECCGPSGYSAGRPFAAPVI